ncbi:hypothetical protein [Amycolatopsis sp. YIM 10]|uniref:hypothetical protein n=1 Tax=Amycolatopsis sp. YIM 10 TaxID=2653857 RepID=UPI00128FF1FB|nr:hypothetical protein [Amycolatopsis sp. YIM 10]QFU86745.1 hypothetical protein YIM_07670 [Amycolatopsis sp. YIM 10]
MTEEDLARTTTTALSHYLRRKSTEGPAAYNAPLEDLLGRVQARLSEPFLAEVFARFVEHPFGAVESETMRLHLSQAMAQDPDFARELTAVLAGGEVSKASKPGRWPRRLLVAATVLVLVALVFVVARVTAPGPAPSPQTTIPIAGPTSDPPPTTSSARTTTTTMAPSSSPASPAIAGDGSSVPKGSPVPLVDLPRPNNDWIFEHGDHDVQLTQYPDSMWNMLATCNSNAYRGEQQFRLKNFSRLEVKAVGTDSTASPELAVKFEIFVNNDTVNAKQTVMVNPGEAKPLTVELPQDVYAVTLRTSFAVPPGKPCRSGNAVWGSPFVVATGS